MTDESPTGESWLRGRVVTPSAVIADGVVAVSGGVICYVGPTDDVLRRHPGAEPPRHHGTLLPGLVDMHCHGGGGHAVTTSDPDEALRVVLHHRSAGTTSVVGSLVTAAPEVLLAQVRALAPLVVAGDLAGLHFEGPFLSEARRGAQAPEFLRHPDLALVDDLLAAADGAVTVMTLAPELPGATEVSSRLRAAGVVVALGHSDATYDVFRDGLRALDGAGLVTHLANGMPPLHHRAAGPVGAALVEAAAGRASVELIADGVHLDDGFASLVFAAVEPGRVALVTDAMAAAGMPDGDYVLGPQRVQVRDGVARLAPAGSAAGETPSIAGGTSHLLEIVARVASRASVPLVDAVGAASRTPARLLGIDDRVGALAAGLRADVLVVDDALRLERVMHRGEWLT